MFLIKVKRFLLPGWRNFTVTSYRMEDAVKTAIPIKIEGTEETKFEEKIITFYPRLVMTLRDNSVHILPNIAGREYIIKEL